MYQISVKTFRTKNFQNVNKLKSLLELLLATNQAAVKMSVIKFESLGWEVDRVGSVGGVKLQMSGGR